MKKVLIVDDEAEIIDLVQKQIQNFFVSLKFSACSDGLDAFLSCQDTKFDLIITDVKMPYMSGIELISALKNKPSLNRNTPVLILSGFLDTHMREKLRKQNIQFLSKPFSELDLYNVILEFLE